MRFSELEGQRIGVWGAGAEIRSLVSNLDRLPGAEIEVCILDDPGEDEGRWLRDVGARLVEPDRALAALADCDVLVRSPGVSIHRPEIAAIRDAGLKIATPTGLWLAEHGAEGVIGATGTKGKSTTAALIAHLAGAGGTRVSLAGNIGVPALELLDAPRDEPVVLELSSFQIADLAQGPEVALVTNMLSEHLDWHDTVERYRDDKLRLLSLPGVKVCVLDGRDQLVLSAPRATEDVRLFGTEEGWSASAAGVHRHGELVASADSLPLLGTHNLTNLCAAMTALEAAGIEVPDPPGGLDGFRTLPHRLESIGEHEGVLWVDDSISTTAESAMAAVESFPDRHVVLIAGGQDRRQDYAELGELLSERGADLLGVPSTGKRAVEAARRAGLAPENALALDGLPAAVAAAVELASPGSVILLSPGAPSFDHFKDFKERGERFRQLSPIP